MANRPHKLSTTLGVTYSGGVQFWDMLRASPRLTTVEELDDDEMWELIKWYTDRLCPRCGNEINDGAAVCDDCFKQAQNYREQGPPVAV